MKFDASPDLQMGKQVSISHPSGWGKGGDYKTPDQGVGQAKEGGIVTSGGGSSGKWARGGPEVNVGKQKVEHCKPL
jgi:hypothetical protein